MDVLILLKASDEVEVTYKQSNIHMIQQSRENIRIKITDKGIISVIEQKYVKQYWKEIRDRSIYVSQVTIPILSVVFSAMIFMHSRLDNEVHTKKIELLQDEIQGLKESAIDTLTNE